MSDQLFRVVGSGTYLADEPDNKGRLRVDGFVVPVEPVKRIGRYDVYLREPPEPADAALKGADDD